MNMNIVYNEDCMATMSKYPTKYFDLAVVDPPYFSGPEKRMYYGSSVSTKKVRRRNYGKSDTWQIPGKEYFDELYRVSKHQIIWGINYYEQYAKGTGRIIWDKVNGDSSFSDCEIAYCSLHDSVRMFRYMWNGMQQGKSITEGHIMQGNKALNEERIHPTQKPVNLYKWVFSKYATSDMKVLDTHIGSGSIRIAADDMGIDLVGAEIDTAMFLKQDFRFQKHKQQLKLIL